LDFGPSARQPGAKCEFAHGWWNFAEFLQLLSGDFASFDFGVLTSYSGETPPPTTLIAMPVVSARSQNLEVYFKESWVVEPNYMVTVQTQSPASFILLDILQPVDPKDQMAVKGFSKRLCLPALSASRIRIAHPRSQEFEECLRGFVSGRF
jgi:hypothetical protein